MNRNPFHLTAQLLRITVAACSILITLWAFAWVLTRPLRTAGDDPNRIELTVLHWSGGGGPEEDQIIIDLLDAFQERNPHIRIKRINPGDAASLYTKLQTMFAAGTPPDVFYMGSERVASFAGKNLLMPIDALIESDRGADADTLDLDDFYAPTVDCFRFDGQRTGRGPLYGVPKDFTTVGFYYNKDLFDRAGVPYPPDDWTWDEFAETARRLGRLDGVTGAEFVTWSSIVRLFLWTHGLDVANDDFTEWHVTDPEVIATLNRIADWRFNETGTLTSGKSQVATGEDVFVSGRVAMAGPFGRWVVPTYRKIRDFRWDFAPLPHASVKANVVFTVAWSIARESRHPQQAWELVKFLTGPEGQARAARLGLAIPTLKSVSRSDAFVQPDIPPSRDYVYLDQAEYARVVPWPSEPRYEQQFANRMDEALMSGVVNVEQAAENVLRDWRRIRETPLAATDFPPMPWARIVWFTLLPILALLLFGLY
ncbi:MAG: sugar ABC transporter substrate-binding protein, partial [Planctomycetota bacterium]